MLTWQDIIHFFNFSLRSYGPGDPGVRKFGSMAPKKFGNLPQVGEQIVGGKHVRDKSHDQSLRKTESFSDAKSMSGYRGYSQKKFDTKSKFGRASQKGDMHQANLRDQTVGPYT